MRAESSRQANATKVVSKPTASAAPMVTVPPPRAPCPPAWSHRKSNDALGCGVVCVMPPPHTGCDQAASREPGAQGLRRGYPAFSPSGRCVRTSSTHGSRGQSSHHGAPLPHGDDQKPNPRRRRSASRVGAPQSQPQRRGSRLGAVVRRSRGQVQSHGRTAGASAVDACAVEE